MTTVYGKLCKTIKLDDDHIWDNSGTIEDSIDKLESQIDNWQITLIYKKYKHKRMTKDKDDDDI